MQLFSCQNCGQLVYFENTACVRCGHRLGYLPEAGSMSAVEPDGADWRALADRSGAFRFCANWELNACNWLVPANGDSPYCIACQHNRTIPDLSVPGNPELWAKLEQAKRRLFYSLLKLGLPMPTEASGDPEPLVFDFLAETPGGPRVMTGHDNGLITISLAEADDAQREVIRNQMHEPYRTLLGHFRHEVGHYFWDKLVDGSGSQEAFRAVFGDEREDYGAALQRHYEQGPAPGWQDGFVSEYATTHPWEDWAETFAHYLHIVDTLEMAGAFGISVKPEVSDDPSLEVDTHFDPYRTRSFSRLIEAWLPLSYAVNSLNRSMGQPDLYPFVLSQPAIDKLAFIHDLLRRQRH